ncbi:Claspin, partial [Caligus rogercresseyi]
SASLLEDSDDENAENAGKDDSQLIQLGNKALKRLESVPKTLPKTKDSDPSHKLLPLQSLK